MIRLISAATRSVLSPPLMAATLGLASFVPLASGAPVISCACRLEPPRCSSLGSSLSFVAHSGVIRFGFVSFCFTFLFVCFRFVRCVSFSVCNFTFRPRPRGETIAGASGWLGCGVDTLVSCARGARLVVLPRLSWVLESLIPYSYSVTSEQANARHCALRRAGVRVTPLACRVSRGLRPLTYFQHSVFRLLDVRRRASQVSTARRSHGLQ